MFKSVFTAIGFMVLGLLAVFVALFVVIALRSTAKAQSNVPCWEVPNGLNRTMLCQNGYWQTVTPEGTVHHGNGPTDPSAIAMGSSIVINPTTGGPFIGAGQTVVPPTQVLPMLEPYQANQYGFMPRQD